MAVARKIAYNVVFSSVSKVLSTVLALVSIGFITRYLGKEGFGNYATVLAFLSFFSAILDLGLYSISTREISRPGAEEEKIMSSIFSLRLLSSLIVLVLAPLVIWFLPYPEEVKKGIFIVGLSFVFSSGYQVLNGVFQKNLAMDRVAFSELLGKIVQVGLVVMAVKLNLGFDWIIASLLLNMIISFFLVYFWSKKFIRLKLSFDFEYWKVFLKNSFPMGIAALISFIYFKIDTILLSLLRDSSEVGIYNVAYKVIENITFFPTMIIGLILPIMSGNIFHNKERFQEISDKTFKVFVILVVPLIIITLFLADGIVGVISGSGFSESVGVLKVLVFALAFIFFGNFFNTIMISANFQKKLMWIMGIAAIFNVFLNLLLIPRFSYLGAAWVSVLTEFIVVFLGFIFVKRKLGYFPRIEKIGGIVFSAVIMSVFLAFFQGVGFIGLLLGGSLVYGFSLLVFRVVTMEEIRSIISKKSE